MLVAATKEDMEQYMDFAYSLALAQTKSGYRLFSDGVSTKEQFIEHTRRGYQEEDQELLLFVADGEVEGWIQFYFIKADRYLQTTSFLTNRKTEQALSEFLEYTDQYFAGYELYLGFPKKNSRAIAYLREHGCRLAEESYHDIFILDGFDLPPAPDGAVRVTESNFSDFRELHQTEPDTYWNSDRMYAALDKWIIYLLYQEERAADYHHLIFFHDEENQEAGLELGFSCVSDYALYIR